MIASLFNRWTWIMAWRDSRTHRKRLLLFISSIMLGTAALVAVNSLGESLERAVSTQAKSLLGADLGIESRQPFSKELERAVDSLAERAEIAREISFGSMVYFPKQSKTRLSQIRAVTGNFPFYGAIETEPKSAYNTLNNGRNALIDNTLAIQFGVQIGDSVKIGDVSFLVSGILKEVPGEAAVASVIGPRVYIPPIYVDSTKLIQVGSRVTYKAFFKLPPATSAKAVVDSLKPLLNLTSATATTAEERQASLGRTLENLYRFLNLVGFIALLLGSVGVASAVNVYVKQKLQTVATLRCMGASSAQAFAIYLIQTFAMGLIGVSLGAMIGVFVSAFLPRLLGDFLPIQVEFVISLSAIAVGVSIGLLMAIAFALLPLLTVRNVSPLLVLRASVDDEKIQQDYLRYVVFGLIVMVVWLFASLQTDSALSFIERLKQGAFIMLGLGVSLGLLALVAKGTMVAARKFFPKRWNYVWRQGLANLYRPNNQTLVLILSLGFGTMLISLMYLLQAMLIEQVELTSKENQPNLVFFDVQSDQRKGVEELLTAIDAPVMQTIPIVTMRIAAVKGKTIAEARRDSTVKSAWLWEYRVSYRDTLNETETLIKGEMNKPVKSPNDSIKISINEFLAQALEVDLNDEISFDVQGVLVKCFVGSIRKVDFRRIQPSFSILFPTGVLEDAPQFYAVLTRASSDEHSAEIQQAMVEAFPNVSAIDLGLILSTVDSILDKISLVIEFMALFSILTGVAVLIGSVLISRFQRMRESVLLRTLGAVRKQVVSIMTVEYLLLGFLASLSGVVLSAAASVILAYTVFKFTFAPNLLPMMAMMLVMIALTVVIGVQGSRGVHSHSPLEVLRNEV
ncbi:MAG: ABC transporter permease [Chloroherpetonaceae bacterium]